MSEKYIPLYRKYRPKNLQEVVGQEHIKKALANAITLNRISHAYLFTGPRGTGKTSVARILAKSLNCKEGPTLTPCENCPSCVDIANSTPIDVIEIDAASNRKVEDAQNILEKIQYVPVNGKYKIYIIDEVHMLTNHAFNALLKTLEEPPENVIFILATTEPQKVLETITSRCQRFDFRRITTNDIIGHLKEISKLEKIKIEDDALFTIAKNAAGGMRDSLALLDQVSVLDGQKKITSEDVNALLGRLSFDVLNSLSESIINSNSQSALEGLEKIYNSGNEPSQILLNLLAYFKNLLIVKNCVEADLLADLTQLNETQIAALKKQAENVETFQVVFLTEKISYYIKELKTTNNQHLWLEISMIDLSNLAQNTSLIQLQERVARLESGLPAQTPQVQYATQPQPVAKPILKEPQKVEPKHEAKSEPKPEPKAEVKPSEEKKAPAPQAEPQEQSEDFSPMPKAHPAQKPESLSELWKALLSNIESAPARAFLASLAKPIEITPQSVIISFEKENFVKQANEESKKLPIINAAEKLFGTKGIHVVVRTSLPSDKTPLVQPSAPLPVEKKTPIAEIEQSQEEIEEKEDIIEEELAVAAAKQPQTMPSDQVSMVMNLFDGKYID